METKRKNCKQKKKNLMDRTQKFFFNNLIVQIERIYLNPVIVTKNKNWIK